MRKTTKKEKILAGTFQPCRDKVLVTTDPLTEIPDPDYELDPVELTYFTRCASLLIAAGTLTDGDVPGMTRASSWFGIWQNCLADIRQHGAWQTTNSGWSAKTAAFQAANDAEKNLTAWERSQGLNLTSRAKLPPPPEPKQVNPIDLL